MRETSSGHKNNIIIAIMLTWKQFGGEKDKWMIAFCGFGLDASSYASFYEEIKQAYNLIVFENPEQAPLVSLTKDDYISYIKSVLHQADINEISIISYSLGSRFNFVCLEKMPEMIEHSIFIAPDGLGFWDGARWSTSLLLRPLFRLFVRREELFLTTLKLIRSVRLIPKGMYVFSKWRMRTREERQLVYNTWMNIRNVRPSLIKLKKQDVSRMLNIYSYFGAQDILIPQSHYRRMKYYFPEGQHTLLQKDHLLFDSELFKEIAKHI